MKKAETQTLAPSAHALHLPLTQPRLVVFAWAATLLLSSLPLILARELNIFPALPVPQLQIILLLGFIALGFVWQPARLLRAYFVIFLVLFLANEAGNGVSTLPFWRQLLARIPPGFPRDLLGTQALRFAVACIMIVTVWLVCPRWGRFMLARGNLNATAEPVRWLGMDRPLSWGRFGLILSACITLGTLIFLIVSARPTSGFLPSLLRLLPVVLLVAAVNAFSEEIIYRASLLAPLNTVLGKSQALLLTAALFGLWHFYGVPYGIVGVVMAGVLGWLLGKSMLETKGIFWAFFIHFWQDVAIFAFLAAGSVVPGS